MVAHFLIGRAHTQNDPTMAAFMVGFLSSSIHNCVKFNSIQIQNLLLLYSVQSEINFMNKYTYGECYDLQLIGSWSYWYDSTSFR